MIALRVAQRKTSWETSTIDELVRTEFKNRRTQEIDLAISTYEIEDSEATVVRAYAEHCASLGLNPKTLPHIDLSGRSLEATPGETRFQFTVNAHRELRFNNVSELQTYLRDVILPQAAQRRREVRHQDVRTYARAQRDAHVQEWVEFFADNPRWP